MGDHGSHRSDEPLLPGAPLGVIDIDETSREAEETLGSGPVTVKVFWRVAWWESKNLWRLSWASVIISVFNFMLSLATQMFVGHLGALELAGASIANVGIQGLAYAVQTVCGQAYGAKKYRAMGVVCQKAMILHLGVVVPLGLLYWYSGPFLRAIGQADDIASSGQSYARGLLPQLVAYALYLPMQRFLQAQNIVNPVAALSVAVFGVHVLMTWAVVYKLRLGLVGAALTLSLSWWLLTVATWIYILRSASCRETWTGLSRKAFKGLWPYFKLTLASAVMLCANYLSMNMMVMLGISNAASIRVGNELGAAHPRVARFAVIVVVSTCIVISIILSGIVLLFREPLSKLYTSSQDVIDMVVKLMPLLAISVFLNGIQPILSGVAIGSGWQAIVAYVNGLWWGLILGVFVQTIVLIVITARTNWNKQVDNAADRLKREAADEGPSDLIDDV
ncbi:Protein TRANSPARENT TESTA 12 [Acorus calamus]|uniref:Protein DETOXIFICATION n=1 Tax=Acorus calamus TaxID=4465 RepID=A0AAV9FJ78_ACOCL|nr:Protein TRANSPARENT TESTA 12 [Acorus calamus]